MGSIEDMPPIVNTQSVAYLCEGNLCDANYVGYAIQHAPTSTRQLVSLLCYRKTSYDNTRAGYRETHRSSFSSVKQNVPANLLLDQRFVIHQGHQALY